MKLEFMGDSLSEIKTQIEDFLNELGSSSEDSGSSGKGTGKGPKKETKKEEVITHDTLRDLMKSIEGKGPAKKQILNDFGADSVPEVTDDVLPKVYAAMKKLA